VAFAQLSLIITDWFAIARHLPRSPSLLTSESRAEKREPLHDGDGGAGRGDHALPFLWPAFALVRSMAFKIP